MKTKKLLSYEWDAIAGILAAIAAIILHLLHIVDEHIVLPIILALMGLLFINFMRHTKNNELTDVQVKRTGHAVEKIQAALKLPDVILIGPRQLRSVNERFFKQMKGDAVLFNVCLAMYKNQPLFDALLRPVIENSAVTSIQLILDNSQKELWQEAVQPKIEACIGHAKVREPRWRNLSQSISFILADNHQSDGAEALLSFWGEPFMAKSTGKDVPRFIFHVQKHSELLSHLVELVRGCEHN